MNPYSVVREFEETIAEYAGAKYGVAVESCTAALFLSCVHRQVKNVSIPKNTYPSVPCSIIHAGGAVHFHGDKWEGLYELHHYGIWDGALRFQRGMYAGGFHCLSFHIKKHLPIGRGGMVLTDSEPARDWFRKARFDGRGELPLEEDSLDVLGWNMYMEPAQAIRGLQLFESIKTKDLPDLPVSAQGYANLDLSRFPIYSQQVAALEVTQ